MHIFLHIYAMARKMNKDMKKIKICIKRRDKKALPRYIRKLIRKLNCD